MSLRGGNDRNVDCAMFAVHGRLLCLRASVDVVHVQTYLPSVLDRPESEAGGADPRGSSGFAS